MKSRVILLFLSAVVVFSLCSAATGQELAARTLRRMPIEKNEPLTITDIKVNGQSISFDKKFAATDEWLRSLVVSIKNKSDMLILFASIQLQFPRSSESKDRFSVFTMSTGNAALWMRAPTLDEKLIGIRAGEMADIQISAQEFVELRVFLDGTGYPASIDKVDFRISSVIFADDTMWRGGESMLRDPKVPGKWTRSDSVENK